MRIYYVNRLYYVLNIATILNSFLWVKKSDKDDVYDFSIIYINKLQVQ